MINNSPIRPYHVLLVPDRQLEQLQVNTQINFSRKQNTKTIGFDYRCYCIRIKIRCSQCLSIYTRWIQFTLRLRID